MGAERAKGPTKRRKEEQDPQTLVRLVGKWVPESGSGGFQTLERVATVRIRDRGMMINPASIIRD